MIRDWKDKAQALVDAHHSKHPHGDPSVAHVSMRVRVDESGNIVNLPLKGPNDKAEAIISRYREEFGSNTTEAEFMATIEAIWPNLPKPPLGYILAEDKVVPIQDEKDTTTPNLGEPGWITCTSGDEGKPPGQQPDESHMTPDALADITKKLMGPPSVLKTCAHCGGKPEVSFMPAGILARGRGLSGYGALRCGGCGIHTGVVEIQEGHEEDAFKTLMLTWNKRAGG